MQPFHSISTLVSLTALCCIFQPIIATAQIIPDNSLGNESSVVVPNLNINNINSERIDGGAIRGSNLFHSFQEFNIDNGRGAYFSNPGNISNILTRVTGSNISNIFGTLGVLGNANLFLINPNGIVFGPNARLDVGGSFFASTADSILFENGVEIAASNPDAPPLLTINIPIGLNFRENPGSIINQAILTTLEDGSPLRDNNGFLTPQGLNVPQNQTLALVGGNVVFDNGVTISPGSNIELGGLSEPGIVELNADGSLTFPANIQQANIALTNNSQINIRADNGGDININSGNFEMSGGSVIRAGIDEFLGSPEAQVGIININAQDAVSITEDSFVSNVINTDGIGQPGEINVTANSVSMSDGSFFGTQSFGQGGGGDINIITNSLLMTSESVIVTTTYNQGNAGSISIITDSIELSNAGIFSPVEENAIGNGGNITIQASESVQLMPGAILSDVEENATGNAGNITIETPNLRIFGQSIIYTGTAGAGNAGNVTIRASDSVQLISGGILSDVLENAVGNAGNITIETPQLRMTDEAQIIASTNGEGNAGNVIIRASESAQLIFGGILSNVLENAVGNAGNITIETPQLRMIDGTQINVLTNGEGNGGTITVKAENIHVSGNTLSPEGRSLNSGFLAQSNTSGNAGTIVIEAQQLRITDGAAVSVSSDDAGDAGTIIVRANNVELLDGLDSQNTSSLDASVKLTGTGSGGSVTIEAERLVLRNGGRIEARTANGTGESGQVTITASESVELSGITPDRTFGGSIFTNTTGTANAGDITIFTRSLSIRDKSSITAGSGVISDTVITGNGGNIQIFAADSVELIGLDSEEGGISISSTTFGQGDAGNISITTNQLRVLDRAVISVLASENNGGEAGKILINAAESVELKGSTTGLLAATDGSGNAGNVDIITGQLSIRDGAGVGVGSESSGIPGNINISANETLLENQSLLNADSEAGQGGSIRLQSNDVRLLNGSRIRATGSQSGETFEGNIEIDADLLVLLQQSRIITDASSPSGGSNINIQPFNDANVVIIQSNDSIINAAGNLTIDSSVTFQPAEVPEVAVMNPNDLIAQEFCRQRGNSQFTITGRGGIAAGPNDKSDGNQINVDLVEPVLTQPQNISQKRSEIDNNQAISSLDIIPARGWIKDENGDVILVSYDPTKIGVNRQPSQLPQCQP
jgi:filamentous hemagglutinin family protein